MEFIETQRGGYALVYDGHRFRKDYSKAENTYWKCVESSCRSRCVTDATLKTMKKGPSTHSHPPNEAEVDAKKIITGIKRRCLSEPMRPVKEVYDEALRNLDGASSAGEVTVPFPLYRQVKSSLYRKRRKLMSQLPQREDMQMDPALADTKEGRSFLLCENAAYGESSLRRTMQISPNDLSELDNTLVPLCVSTPQSGQGEAGANSLRPSVEIYTENADPVASSATGPVPVITPASASTPFSASAPFSASTPFSAYAAFSASASAVSGSSGVWPSSTAAEKAASHPASRKGKKKPLDEGKVEGLWCRWLEEEIVTNRKRQVFLSAAREVMLLKKQKLELELKNMEQQQQQKVEVGGEG